MLDTKWGEIQFYHDMGAYPKKRTYALEVPSREILKVLALDLLNGNRPQIEFKVGYSIVNPEDNYNKSIGRNISCEKLKMEKFCLEEFICNKPNRWVLEFKSEKLQVAFRLNPNIGKPYFIFADIYE